MSRIMLSTSRAAQVFLSVASLGLGFYIGSRHPYVNDNLQTLSSAQNADPLSTAEEYEDKGEDEVIPDGDLSTIQAGLMEQCKLVLVVRTDLKMSPGKIAAQCGHATLACYKALAKSNSKLVQHWERTGQAKIALKATSEEQLLELEEMAKSLNLCARSIQAHGLTQVAEGSRTVLGIGPAPVPLVNKVTGKLRLL